MEIGEVPKNCRRTTVVSSSKKVEKNNSENCRPVEFTLICEENHRMTTHGTHIWPQE